LFLKFLNKFSIKNLGYRVLVIFEGGLFIQNHDEKYKNIVKLLKSVNLPKAKGAAHRR
jgi:hypothetical protein